MNFGAILRARRKAAHLTFAQLAQLTLIPSSSLNRWEIGQTEPRLSDLERLAEAFGVTVAQLLTDSPATNKSEGGITMTLNDLFDILSADRATVRTHITPRLTADIPVDLSNTAEIEDIVEAYGRRTVKLLDVTYQPGGPVIKLE